MLSWKTEVSDKKSQLERKRAIMLKNTNINGLNDNEYDGIMKNAQLINDVFRLYGYTMCFVQAFESEFIFLLTFVFFIKGELNTNEELTKFMRKMMKCVSLWSYNDKLKNSIAVDSELVGLLDFYRENRNYITHEFFFLKHSKNIHTNEGKQEMIKELRSLRDTFSRAYLLTKKMKEFYEKEIEKLPMHRKKEIKKAIFKK